MGLDACLLKKLEVVDRGLKICLSDTLNGESNTVLAGIENAVLAGAVILELKHYVAIVKLVNVLCFSCVNFNHF